MADDSNPLFERAVAAHQADRQDLAEQLYREVLAMDPRHGPALANLGSLQVNQGKLTEAIGSFQAAIDAAPDRPDGYYNLANLLRRVGRIGDAEKLYRKALEIDPAFARAHHNLGLVLGQMGRWTESAAAYGEALRLEPQYLETHNLLGQALLQAGNLDAAAARFQRFTRVAPNDPRGFHNWALVLVQQDKYEEARSALESAIKLKPDYAEAYNTRAFAFFKEGRQADALANWRRALELRPAHPEFLANLAAVAEEAGDTEAAVNFLEKSIERFPHNAVVRSGVLRLSCASSMPPERLTEEHAKWAAAAAGPAGVPPSPMPMDADPEKTLTVGYVFGETAPADVRAFLGPLLKAHDRTKARPIAFANSRSPELLKALRATTAKVVPVDMMNDVVAGDRLVEENVDILVDLSGHHPGNRLPLFLRRRMPVQAALFGYPATTGLSSIDYRIGDAYSEPPGDTDRLYTEKLWRLPDTAWFYTPPPDLPECGPPPCEANGFITFGTVQTLRRILPGMIDVWAVLMKEEPTARFQMIVGRNGFGDARFNEIWKRNGVDPARVKYLPRLAEADYFRSFQGIDVALDTFPANGRLSTADALVMGVPVVSLASRTSVSRQGLAILRNVDLTDLVAWKPEEYTATALRLARDPARLASLRTTLRSKLLLSPLCDAERYTRNLETAYRGMWKRAVAKA